MKRITAETKDGTLTALVCEDCLEGLPEGWRKLSEEEVPGHVCGVCGRDFEKEWKSLSAIGEKVFESVEAKLDGPGPIGEPEPDPSQLSEGEIEVLKRSTAPTKDEINGLVPESFDVETLRPEPALRLGPVPSRSEIEHTKAEFGKVAEKVRFKLAELADVSDKVGHEHLCQKCCFLYKTKDLVGGEHDCPKCGYRQSCSLERVKARLRDVPPLTSADLDFKEMESRSNPGGGAIFWLVVCSIFWLVVFGIVWLVFK